MSDDEMDKQADFAAAIDLAPNIRVLNRIVERVCAYFKEPMPLDDWYDAAFLASERCFDFSVLLFIAAKRYERVIEFD